MSQETNPWLSIDLEKETFVYKIKTQKALNVYGDGPASKIVKVKRNLTGNGLLCCRVKEYNSNNGKTCTCKIPIFGRIVTLELQGQNAVLSICDVSVFVSGEQGNLTNYCIYSTFDFLL